MRYRQLCVNYTTTVHSIHNIHVPNWFRTCESRFLLDEVRGRIPTVLRDWHLSAVMVPEDGSHPIQYLRRQFFSVEQVGSNTNDSDLPAEGDRLEYQSGSTLSWLMLFVFFGSPSKQTPGQCLKFVFQVRAEARKNTMFFWDVTSRQLAEDGDNRFLRSTGTDVLNYTVSHFRRPHSFYFNFGHWPLPYTSFPVYLLFSHPATQSYTSLVRATDNSR
jgi:hypothetical protein